MLAIYKPYKIQNTCCCALELFSDSCAASAALLQPFRRLNIKYKDSTSCAAVLFLYTCELPRGPPLCHTMEACTTTPSPPNERSQCGRSPRHRRRLRTYYMLLCISEQMTRSLHVCTRFRLYSSALDRPPHLRARPCRAHHAIPSLNLHRRAYTGDAWSHHRSSSEPCRNNSESVGASMVVKKTSS